MDQVRGNCPQLRALEECNIANKEQFELSPDSQISPDLVPGAPDKNRSPRGMRNWETPALALSCGANLALLRGTVIGHLPATETVGTDEVRFMRARELC